MVVLATVVVACLFALVSRHRSRVYRYAGGVALAGHVFVAVAVVPRLPYQWDVPLFHENAMRILAGGETAPLSVLDAFGTVQALVYALFGADPTTLAIVNGLFAVLIPLPACYLADRLYGSLESTDGLLLVLLFLPAPFVFNSLPMRDALSTLLALALIALVVRVLVDRHFWSAPALPPLWGMLFLLREELALLILLGAAGSVLVAVATELTGRRLSIASLSLVAAPIGLLGVALFSRLFPVDVLNARLQYRSAGGAAYLESMHYESWFDVILAAPIRAIYFQFAPFPLHVDSVFDLLAALSLPLLIVLVTTSFLSLRAAETDPVVEISLLIFYFGGILGYGLIDSNFGTTIRHRILFVFLLGVFSAPVFESWLHSVRRRVDDARGEQRQSDEKEQETEELDAGAEVGREH